MGIYTPILGANEVLTCRDIDFKPGSAYYLFGTLITLTPEPIVYFSTFNSDLTISLFEVQFGATGFGVLSTGFKKIKMSNPQHGLTIGGVRFSRYAFLGKYFLIDHTKGGLTCFKDFSPSNFFTFITTSTFADTRESDSCLTLNHF